MAVDPDLLRHKEWLGFLQPVGLVVSPPALVKAQCLIDRHSAIPLQQELEVIARDEPMPGRGDDGRVWIAEFREFAQRVLEWESEDLGEPPPEVEVVLPDYGETLKPTWGIADPDREGWMLLVREIGIGSEFDAVESEAGWKATPQEKFERRLRESGVAAGLLWNGVELRLVYAPRGESSGHVTFPIGAMTEVQGRPILAALTALLGVDRLFNVPQERRLLALLENSRKYQNEVSTKLAEQVLDALWELLRGMQVADAATQGTMLGTLACEEPQHIYGGLLTTMMRLVFLLYAEDEGLMPGDAVYQQNYAVSGLYEKLRADAGAFPDTMDQRYGAWAGLLSMFRLVYDGGGAYEAYLPARHGQLFDPDEYPFLEGRSRGSSFRDEAGRSLPVASVPRIPDGTVFAVLDKLLVLEGERLSYRALDVEQIGSVYEAIMGYEVQVAAGASIAVTPKDAIVNVDALLATKAADRGKVLKAEGECKLSGKALTALKQAQTPEDVVAALGRRVSARTKQILPPGTLVLQPGAERRRSGSHYTPRRLTQPIVATTLQPILARLGERPTAAEILDLKVCDLAMGSAAFLVEACRQLAEKVVEAWTVHGMPENVPDAVEPLLYARRLVAQRCLYGVDKNPFAVNLAKLSLWLVTLAKDLPFTFVDHALKCGDSLVGVRSPEFNTFMAASDLSDSSLIEALEDQQKKVKWYRDLIAEADAHSDAAVRKKQAYLERAELESVDGRLLSDVAVAAVFASHRKHSDDLSDQRLMSDVALAAFFTTLSESKRNAKKITRELATKVNLWRSGSLERSDIEAIASIPKRYEKPVLPFHWETEFPRVFDRENPGFDAIVGNPPFAGKNTLIEAHPEGYLSWLRDIHPESHGNSDLVAHFFRRGFTLLRQGGALGLIATNTIAQGDTRTTGLRFICQHGGQIYNATRRYRWPGVAAVVVSVVHIFKRY